MLARVLKPRGLTLVEILAALALTGVALLTMMGVFITALKLMSGARDRAAGLQLAREMLESVSELGFDALPAEARWDGRRDPATNGFPPSPYPTVDCNDQHFALIVTVRTLSPTLKSVTSRAVWGERGQVTLQTYFRK